MPLAWFGVLLAGYNLIDGFAAKSAALGASRFGRRPLLAVAGVLPVVAYFGMASFFGWGGILFGFLFKIGRGLGGVLFLEALNERISSAFRATVISLSQLGNSAASFCLLGPLVGYGIDAWGLPSVLSALGILFSIAFVVPAPAGGVSRGGKIMDSRPPIIDLHAELAKLTPSPAYGTSTTYESLTYEPLRKVQPREMPPRQQSFPACRPSA